MKKILILGATALTLVACNKEEQSAKQQIENEKEAQKTSLNQEKKDVNAASEQAKDQVDDQAKMEKKQIENEADAQKAALDAQKKAVEAQADAAKASVENSVNNATNDLRGLNPGFRGNETMSLKDRMLNEGIQRAWADKTDAKNVTVSTMDGKVTLIGTVHSAQAKMNMETAAKAFPGVKSVDNKLEVTP